MGPCSLCPSREARSAESWTASGDSLEWARVWWGLSVARDGKTILASRDVDAGVDLMIIDNFR